jgi:hypothetical protein
MAASILNLPRYSNWYKGSNNGSMSHFVHHSQDRCALRILLLGQWTRDTTLLYVYSPLLGFSRRTVYSTLSGASIKCRNYNSEWRRN